MLTFDASGLIPAVCQDARTGEVRMVAWMNRESVAETLESGEAVFFSRSRGTRWKKGETSGHTLRVLSLVADCDNDTLLVLVEPNGPSCHTGRPSCFFRRVSGAGDVTDEERPPLPFLLALESEIVLRQTSTGEKSYTKSLLEGGALKIGEKLREEADELSCALADESKDRVIGEAADVLYHLLVGLRLRDVSVAEVMAELGRRAGRSGHAEKADRSKIDPEAEVRKDPSRA